MIPGPAVLIGIGVMLMRSSLSGILIGGVLTMAAMHVWPEKMAIPFDMVGEGLKMLGM